MKKKCQKCCTMNWNDQSSIMRIVTNCCGIGQRLLVRIECHFQSNCPKFTNNQNCDRDNNCRPLNESRAKENNEPFVELNEVAQ